MLQDMGMGGQMYDRQSIEKMYGKGGDMHEGKIINTTSVKCTTSLD